MFGVFTDRHEDEVLALKQELIDIHRSFDYLGYTCKAKQTITGSHDFYPTSDSSYF